MTITIRDLAADDEEAWRALWRGYCDFYETRIPGSVTDATWRRLMDADSPMLGQAASSHTVCRLASRIRRRVRW